jgi:F-type H+-transporting ATPase subunit b
VLTILAAEPGTPDNPILPTVPEMFWGAISFAALFVLVKYVLLPPVKKVMDERASQIRTNRDAADRARGAAGSAAGEVHDQLADVRAEAALIIDAARAEAEAERSRIIGAAEAEASALKAAAEAEVEAARAEALVGVGPQVTELAANAASRVMGRNVDVSTARPMVERYLSNPN